MSADIITALRLLVDAPGDLSDADLAARAAEAEAVKETLTPPAVVVGQATEAKMSGGKYDYFYRRDLDHWEADDIASRLAELGHQDASNRVREIAEHLQKAQEIRVETEALLKAVEWIDSGDSLPGSEQEAVAKWRGSTAHAGGASSADVLTALRLLVDAPGDLSDADLAALDALRGDLGTRLREERQRRQEARDPLASRYFRGHQPGWRAIAIPDMRRGLWMREHADDRGLLVKVDVCAGREGDDWHVELVAGKPVDARDLRALVDCLETLRWVLEMEENRAAPRDEERAGWDDTLKVEDGLVSCTVCGEQCWKERSPVCRGEAERRCVRSPADG